uniref:suppressor of cytokine signaling 1-like n=1 Tax=Scatophagus argus TaxID=75038 RepID=UPI001ED8391A|nr:suppressor of cytokine signaling 1-like [Scatophagus argus]
MVRDDLDRTVPQRQKQNRATETQGHNQPPEEPAEPERAQSLEKANPERQQPTESVLGLLDWDRLSLEDETDSWQQALNGSNAESLPTHLRPFSSAAEYKLVRHTYLQLQHSGYYWGSMTMEEAHKILSDAPLGTFLIRDSGQPDVFFTLSYQSDDGPTSIRVQLNNLHFSLYGSRRTFASLFDLLTYYTRSSCKLTVPYRKQRPEHLKQMCRRALIRSYGAENMSALPGLSIQVKNYILAYPHCT